MANICALTRERPRNTRSKFKFQRHVQDPLHMTDQDELKEKLDRLVSLHRDLDAAITALIEVRPLDQLQIQRLKKRKLQVKDQIQRLNSGLLPDIIA